MQQAARSHTFLRLAIRHAIPHMRGRQGFRKAACAPGRHSCGARGIIYQCGRILSRLRAGLEDLPDGCDTPLQGRSFKPETQAISRIHTVGGSLRLRRRCSGMLTPACGVSIVTRSALSIFMCVVVTTGGARADECDAIEDPHAFNLCLAAHGPVYRPRKSHAPYQPQPSENMQPEFEQGMAAPAPKEPFAPAPARPALPKYSTYLNLRAARLSSARANPFALLPEMKRHPTVSQSGERLLNPGLGSGRLP
jgi:hypothetical protein